MAIIVAAVEGDFDSFKQRFDSDPLGRREAAQGHMISLGVDNPNEILVRIDFDSAEDAKSFRDKLRSSSVLQNLTVKLPPTVAEPTEQVSY
jgi:hypothetical protein